MNKVRAIIVGAVILTVFGVFISQAQAAPPGKPKTYHFTTYDSDASRGMAGDWIIIGNLEDYPATAQVFFGNETAPRGTYTLEPRGRQEIQWPDTTGGPVRVVSPDGATFVVTQRVLYEDSFNEVAAVEESSLDAPVGGVLDTSYYFTWYDSKPQNGMKGNWIVITNIDSQTASVDVYIGSTKMGSYQVGAGERIAPSYPDTMGGPVRVTSTNSQRLVVSQRVLYNDSFNEVTGVPAGQLDSIYYFTWYDMVRSRGMNGNWILISNLNDAPVHAQVYIGAGSSPRGTYTIGAHQSATPVYLDLMDGPVRVVCTDCAPGQKILVSQRVLYQDSFEEVQGTPPAGLADELYYGWYDFKAANDMKGNWILIANQGIGNATADVYIGSSTQPVGTYNIGEGDRVTPLYPELMDGPVRVKSRGGQPLMVSQRVLYKNSFNELLGLTRAAVGDPGTLEPKMTLYKLNAYWADYNDYLNGKLSVDMRIANTGQGDAFGASVTSITANNGVTVSNPMPMSLGNIPGGGSSNFTIHYSVPQNVTSFNTKINFQCQDANGTWYNYSL